MPQVNIEIPVLLEGPSLGTAESPANAVEVIRGALQYLIRAYQKYISRFLGSRCRFYPSCSHYAHECLAKYPLARALPKVLGRLARCQPWHPGGFDLP